MGEIIMEWQIMAMAFYFIFFFSRNRNTPQTRVDCEKIFQNVIC